MKRFTAVAFEAFPFVRSGDDIARIIIAAAATNGLQLENGDVVVIAQKIVSKAEGRVVRLKDVTASDRARKIARRIGRSSKLVQLVLSETRKVLKFTREILLVEDKRGLVCINAGIDKSNIEGIDCFALLPKNPDESARKCREEIRALAGKSVAVIISDTYSRPFRRGQVNFAIGVAGINPFKDYRGTEDLFGQILKVKRVAVVDEIAAAAELLMGQAREARPVVIFKGLQDIVDFAATGSIEELHISGKEDLFRNSL